MLTNEDSEGQKAFKNGENPFTTTDTSTNENQGGYVIEIDEEELLDTAVRSIIGGIATGLVVNRFLMDK